MVGELSTVSFPFKQMVLPRKRPHTYTQDILYYILGIFLNNSILQKLN